MIDSSAPALNPLRQKWVSVLLALGGAAIYLYASFQPMVNSPLVCCPRLMSVPRFEVRALTDSIPLMIPLIGFVAAIQLIFASRPWVSGVRGLLLSTGLVGAALIVQNAGGLIAVKGGIPAVGALLGFAGAFFILAAGLLLKAPRSDSGSRRTQGTLQTAVPVGILLGIGVFLVAILLPWTNRPFPLKLVSLPHESQYWIWSTVLETAIIFPTTIAAVRVLRNDSLEKTDLGVALVGGVFATLVFVQVVGRVLLSSHTGAPGFSLTWSAYLGLLAGGLIMASALAGVRSVARR